MPRKHEKGKLYSIGCTSRLFSNLDAITSGALILLVVACAFIGSSLPLKLPYIDIDAEYFLDVIFSAQHGSWLSRNVTFTYGPLYQWLWALSSRIHGLSIGSFFRFGYLLPFAFTVLAMFAASRLLLRGHPSWKRALYIIAITYSWSWFEVRHATVLLLFVLSIYELDHAARGSAKLWRAAYLSLCVSAAFLGAADAGAYSVMAFGLAALCSLALFWANRTAVWKISRFIVAAGVFGAGWALLITAVFGFRFWVDTFSTISTYRWALAMPMLPHDQAFLFKTLPITCVVFLIGWFTRDADAVSLARRPLFLLSAPLFSLLYLQSGIVRSDRAHVVFGLFPAMAFAGAICLGSDQPDRRRIANSILTLIAVLMLAHYSSPYPRYAPAFIPAKIHTAVDAYFLHGRNGCPAATYDVDGVCFPPDEFRTLQSVSTYLSTHSRPSDSVFAFPLENYYAILANRRIGGGVLQNYLTAGDTLVHRKIEQLEKDEPQLAVYSYKGHFPGVDGVPDFTRSPETWLYLQSHYRKAAEIKPGILILERDPTRQRRWRMELTQLPLSGEGQTDSTARIGNFPIADRVNWPADYNLLRLKVLIRYPFLWHFRKPCRVVVIVGLANGITIRTRAVVIPNHEYYIWVAPWGTEYLQNFFSADIANWQTRDLSPPVRIHMEVTPLDWISERPVSISVQSLEAARLSLNTASEHPVE